MLEALQNEAHLQILAALDGQSEENFAAALRDRADHVRVGNCEQQGRSLDWELDDIRAEVADMIDATRKAHLGN